MSLVIVCLVSLSIGILAGALVFRNNPKKAEKIIAGAEADAKEIVAEAKAQAAKILERR